MTTAQERPNGTSSSPPPCPAEISQHETASEDQTTFNRTRCQFTYSDGRRCANERASLCVHHASKRDAAFGAEVAPDAELVALCSDLTNATSINRALTQVFLLMAQGRISQKQAVAFGYITQLLLQTLPGVRSEFVSVYDPNRWRAKLQASLEWTTRPESSSRPPAKVCPQDELSPVNKVNLSPGPLCDQPEPGTQKRPRQDHGAPAATHPGVVILSESAGADERRISHKGVANEAKALSAPANRSQVIEPEASKSADPNFQARVAEVITLMPRSSPPPGAGI